MLHVPSQRDYLQEIIPCYIPRQVRDIGWSEANQCFSYLIPGITPTEYALVEQLERQPPLPLADSTAYLEAFIALKDFKPLDGARGPEVLRRHLEGVLSQLPEVIAQHPHKIKVNNHEIRIPIDRPTRAAISELAQYGGEKVRWRLDPAHNKAPHYIDLTNEQLRAILAQVINYWEGPKGIWAELDKLRARLGGDWDALLALAEELVTTPV